MNFSRDIKISVEDTRKLKHFEVLSEKMFELPTEFLKTQLHQLNILRLASSNTHKFPSHQALENWNRAQNFIHQNPTDIFNYKFIKTINGMLTGADAVERTQDIFSGGAAYLANAEKDRELDYFINEVLPTLINHHPIVASTALRYWIVSLHPFKDGNGRTSQSLGDAWLLMNQFPPLLFRNPYEGHFAYVPNYREEFNFSDALESSFLGLHNAFTFINNN